VKPTAVRLRRAPWLILYWDSGRLIFHNFATGSQVAADPLTARILDFFGRWRSVNALAAHLSEFSVRSVRRAVAELEYRSLLMRRSRQSRDADTLSKWKAWNPAAGFFHLSTKDVPYVSDAEIEARVRTNGTKLAPVPRPVKHYPHARRHRLSRTTNAEEFVSVLRARRTWRRFSKRPVTLDALATLLELSFGVQQWLKIAGLGRMPLKTSPSGGARHCLEAYVLVQNVAGLARGLYHYATDRHELELLRRHPRTEPVTRYLPTQTWFNPAAAIVFMTAVFPRVQWRYQFPRAYRAVLIEAGHVCQTFCLTATWLGLAPFCTMALADSRIERALGIDGVTESVLYAAGVGTRPSARGHHEPLFPGATKTDTTGLRLASVRAASSSPSRRRPA
jgi:SagB-type dehydrogenase family enzyme